MGASIFIRERMQPFSHYSGRAVSLPRANVDTDQIIPKQFLKRIERTGFGPALFYDWRFLADGSPNPEFELNRPSAAGASILIAGPNFGCGSSREHAPWALADYGFRVIIAPSFADIFFGNCCQNGLLAVTLPEPDVQVLARRAEAGGEYIVSVDLVHCRVEDRQGFAAGFDFDPYRREMLLKGLDEIGKTLLEEPRIAAFERRRAASITGGPA
jgi:3-isopropylmalate/(R)-2-methylmalate dehydratase small subunit